MYRIAVSILSGDRLQLADEARRVVAAGADALHLNVVDADARPNLTLAHMVCASLRPACTVPIGVLLHVRPTESLIERFAEAGADLITVHPAGSTPATAEVLRQIHRAGCRAGLVFDGSIDAALLDAVDLLHVSCAAPGSAARRFDEARLRRVEQARALIGAAGREIHLQVDGDLGAGNIARAAAAGADTFVVGRAIFGRSDVRAAIDDLRAALAGARPEQAA